MTSDLSTPGTPAILTSVFIVQICNMKLSLSPLQAVTVETRFVITSTHGDGQVSRQIVALIFHKALNLFQFDCEIMLESVLGTNWYSVISGSFLLDLHITIHRTPLTSLVHIFQQLFHIVPLFPVFGLEHLPQFIAMQTISEFSGRIPGFTGVMIHTACFDWMSVS